MRRLMDAQAVREIRSEMDNAGTAKDARRTLVRAALRIALLTDCGRKEWEKELQA